MLFFLREQEGKKGNGTYQITYPLTEYNAPSFQKKLIICILRKRRDKEGGGDRSYLFFRQRGWVIPNFFIL